MSTANNPQLDPSGLSPRARELLKLKEEVLQEWSKRLRQTVAQAERLPHPILIDTFPALYDNLIQAMMPTSSRLTAGEGTTVASEHGGERARLTNYDARAVIAEYQALRWALLDVLKRNGIRLDENELLVLNTSLDDAIRESVGAFALTQLALRERFVAALTHDLRGPLAAAHISAELIKRSADPKRIKELAGRISDNLNRMDTMIRDLLDSIIFQSGERLRLQLKECDALEIAREVCDQFALSHGPRFQVAGTQARGWWDGEALKRAIENLVDNAVKYGAPGTPVRIAIASQHGRMVLTVHNQGPAIPPEQIECVFQVFQRAATAKSSGKHGWGIGLPYVRSVAESHGGSITVDSTAERGTTFLIDIPLDARPYQEAPVLGNGGPV
ncbi:MAG TPA: HAMP domain-containing sensor histidine kinase [Paucimonas sp.]|nr:HAMP domain-containing sensor histidine kinase [Paucimonas sp.]